MADNQGPVELVFEVKEALSRIKSVEAQYKAALAQMVAATKAGVDQESAEYAQLRQRVKETGTAFLAAGTEGQAAMQRLAQATNVETAETKELAGKIAIARAELDRFHKEGAEGAGGLVKSFGGIRLAIAGIATSLVAIKIKDFFRESVTEAAGAADAYAEIERLIKSTGGAAKRTAEQLGEAATKLSEISVYDDDEILAKTTATLLRFGSLSGETFDRANRDAVDLAATLKTDLAAAADLLGKALLTPGEALRGLKTAGVDFTETETKQIQAMVEHGRVAQAQAIILDRVERATKGAAATYRDTLGGALKAVERDYNDLQEAFGKGLGDELQSQAEGVSKSLQGIAPAAQDAGRGFAVLLDVALKIGSVFTVAIPAAMSIGIGSLIKWAGAGAEKIAELEEKIAGLLPEAIGARLAKAAGEVRQMAEATKEYGAALAEVGNEKLDAFGDSWDDVAEKAKESGDAVTGVGTAAAEALDPLPEKAKKAGKALKDEIGGGADAAKLSLEQMAAAMGLTGFAEAGKEKASLEETIAALKKKQEQGSLTAEELGTLFDAEDRLARVSREVAEQTEAATIELINMEAAGSGAATSAERGADALARMAEAGAAPAARSLGQVAEATRAAREEMEPAVLTWRNTSDAAEELAESWLAAGAGVSELGTQSDSAKAAIAGLAERSGVAATATTDLATGTDQVTASTKALKEEDPAGYARLWAEEMGKVKAAHEWLNGPDGIPKTITLCQELVACLQAAAAAEAA